ncbi:hypothetical protein [Virgisporangium aurantiacum]|uniref:hypothetical protein n=1 Tax=Virgisporangium aurantiacum TaxID=175570 RepID=UPI00194F0B4E|nr:hypothetical protein [Virgisporangium aurantiacum]
MTVALLVGGLAGGLAACGSDGDSGGGVASPPKATTAAAPVSEEARREAIYLEATAAHLCAVQSRVYTDPAEMASAYASKPRYAELTEAEVAAFDERAKTDPAFAVRLSEAITAACSPSAPSASTG